jgi:hypothetical protein
MERVIPTGESKGKMGAMLSSISVQELRKGIADSNARTAVRSMREQIRGIVDKARPGTREERQRLLATTSLTEMSTRPASVFNGPKHVYAGTVSHKTKELRRARNRRARVSRRANR